MAHQRYNRESPGTAAVAEEVAEGFDQVANRAGAAASAVHGVVTAQKELLSPAFAAIQAHKRHEEAQSRLTEAEEAYAEARKKHGRNSEEAAEAAKDVEDANLNLATSYVDLQAASLTLSDTLDSSVLRSLEEILIKAGLADSAIRQLLGLTSSLGAAIPRGNRLAQINDVPFAPNTGALNTSAGRRLATINNYNTFQVASTADAQRRVLVQSQQHLDRLNRETVR
jgi:hypothetical protein